MTRVTKIIRAECDGCGKQLAAGDDFRNVVIVAKRDEVGIRADAEIPDSLGWDGSASELGFDL